MIFIGVRYSFMAVFGGSHPYLRCKPSLSSDLLEKKLYLLASSMLLSVMPNLLKAFLGLSIFKIFSFFRECDVLSLSFDASNNSSLVRCSYFRIKVF